MKGLKIFAWIAIFVSILTIVTFVLLYINWISYPLNNPLLLPDKVQTLTGIIGLVVNTAAGIGGAIAAIYLASLGLEISHRQERKEKAEFVDAKTTKVVEIFSRIIVQLGDVYASAVSVDANIPKISGDPTSLLNQKLPDELSFELNALADNLSELRTAIQELSHNEFAIYCFRQNISNLNSRLQIISDNMNRLGYEKAISDISVSNLSEVSSLIDIAVRKIRKADYTNILVARMISNASDMPIFSKNFDNRSVRTLLFLGALIFYYQQITDNSQPKFIASFGAALIHDLIYSIPDGQKISECLMKRYPEIIHAKEKISFEFEPINILSLSLQKSLSDIDKIGGLYFLSNE